MAGALLRVVHTDRRTLSKWAIAIIVAGTVVRVGWASWAAHAEPLAVRSPDTPGYLGPARALIDTGRFSLSPTDPTPMFMRTPGYPAFLAVILWLTDSEWAISPIQAILSLVAVATTVLVGWRLFGKTVGLVAGAVVAVDPLQFLAAGTIMTESLTTVVLTGIVAVGAMVLALRRPGEVPLAAVCALGVLVAVVTMLRPTFWFYPAVLLVLLAVRFRGLGRRALITRLVVFLLPIVVVVGDWQVRNHSAVNSWQVSGISDINLYCYNAAEVEASAVGISYDAARRRLGCPTEYPNPRGICTRTVGYGCWMPDPEADGQGLNEWGRKGLDIMLDHPVEAGRVLGEGVVREIAGAARSRVTHYLGIDTSPPLTIALSAWVLALWAFAAVGAVVALRSKHRAFSAFVIATIGYVILISTGKAGDARFRTPLVPLIAILAALGIRHCLRRLRRARPRRQPRHTSSPYGQPQPRAAGRPERSAG